MTKATSRKSLQVCNTRPYLNATSGVSTLPAASVTPGVTTYFQSATLAPPVIIAMIGMTMPSTSAVTILPKAAPITTATARSTTLPRAMKALNSESIPMRVLPRRQAGAARLAQGRVDAAVKGGQVVDAGRED